ncbi:hypothetical protein FRC12_024012 [Ceratobasidium sp. 428]|nr:hypothetical protein FRC09_015435 [Ceratobasidium sp. 395]KAG8725811.1 hypothetical protein FRC12_024012 [Ceratobasidium sp. 428]
MFAMVPPTATIATLKELVQGALNTHAESEVERGLPLPVESTDDFMLALRRPNPQNKIVFRDIPEDDASLSLSKLDVRNWDAVYLRWRVDGDYQPVEVTLPSLVEAASDDEDEGEEETAPSPPPNPSKNKGKARA